ncbi:Gamma-glutamylputrescine oxidoreductase [Chromobacterium violaceum]|uniref:Gamma-glutamylputrescine oxidoreductase n=1 Tax=Chromobacterium violaceum TaxID=536 RepID=A0A3S4LI93_CHRVL|nr:Gamma-glutamylputrescine oxidoreductase [Chromobacterium violaceum]
MLRFAHQPHPPSYYAATAHAWDPQPPLRGEAGCDVCVVGGGLAGLSAALNLREKGFSVILLEGSHVGFGASGRNGGQVIAGYAGDIESIRAQVGDEAAKALWDMSVEAVEIIDERVRRHGILCDWQRGYVSAAVKPRHLRELEAWQREAEERYGYGGMRLWDRRRCAASWPASATRAACSIPAPAICTRSTTRWPGRAALAAGVAIHEQTPALRIEQGDVPRAFTEHGVVRCRHLVLACNSYIGALAPQLERRIMPAGTYVIATEPLSEERRAR